MQGKFDAAAAQKKALPAPGGAKVPAGKLKPLAAATASAPLATPAPPTTLQLSATAMAAARSGTPIVAAAVAEVPDHRNPVVEGA